ncbi:MAG: hypothetical protein KKG47_00865 [Proteobacteria bacterium]|nr:hypothetical protein [Pseudomonadota bacterium]MBU1738947.1 hypothetical protein [Pseudomonadota bacterium]
MKTMSHKYAKGLTVLLLTLLFACSPSNQSPGERESQNQDSAQVKASATKEPGGQSLDGPLAASSDSHSLPVRFQTPTYSVAEHGELGDGFGANEEFVVKVGADISSTTGPVKLRDIMKKLASLKKMKISWASDVDQNVLVDVDIRANDDFFKSVDDLLRQRDYFHEVEGNSIVIKYKDTKKFYLALPFIASSYKRSVGSDISRNTSMQIKTLDDSSKNVFDVWATVKLNLDKILQIWSVRTSVEQKGTAEGDKTGTVSQEGTGTASETQGDKSGATAEKKALESETASVQQAGVGFYTIDEPVGIITVTAPRYQLIKIEEYLNSLKKEIYRQINIEAKILEVKVSGSRKVGIDWESLLNEGVFRGSIGLGSSTASQPLGSSGTRSFTIQVPSFNMLVSAIEKQGKTKVLSNPKISVLNGQPAILNVGTNQTYIKDVSQTVDEGVVTYTITTGETSSGIVLSVIANIMENDEIILNMTPVTSLVESLEYETFGSARVGLPVVKVKEMTTLVRIKSGEMLVVGGLIDSTTKDDNENVPLLGRLPLIKRLFSLEDREKTTTELVILLKPEIIS